MRTFAEFNANQARIYGDGFATWTANLRSDGVRVDVNGTKPQSAMLVSLRYPEKFTALVGEFSEEVASTLAIGMTATRCAVLYGPKNAHTTVSDYNQQPDITIDPEQNADQAETLHILAGSVRRALDGATRNRDEQLAVSFDTPLTNGTTTIIPGVSTETVWNINQAVLAESQETGALLKGTWGNHMTVSRFLVAHGGGSEVVAGLADLIEGTSAFGTVQPAAIEVGYFNTDPEAGFVLTPYQTFEL